MIILPEPLEFEWDQGNIDKNYLKHNVTNREAEQAFLNSNFMFKNVGHSKGEDRYGLFGETNVKRYLSVVFTTRKNKVRIITARDMSRKERRYYEKIKNAPTFQK